MAAEAAVRPMPAPDKQAARGVPARALVEARARAALAPRQPAAVAMWMHPPAAGAWPWAVRTPDP